MPWQTIVKTRRTLGETPNLDDYEKACAEFLWTKARNELNGLPDGKGLTQVWSLTESSSRFYNRLQGH